MSFAKKEGRPFVSTVDKYILEKCTVKPNKGKQLKPYRCRNKRHADMVLTEFRNTINSEGPFLLTFEDQVTVEVFRVYCVHDRGQYGYNNARRYFVVCEIELD